MSRLRLLSYGCHVTVQKDHCQMICYTVKRVIIAQFAHPVHQDCAHSFRNVKLLVHRAIHNGVLFRPLEEFKITLKALVSRILLPGVINDL